MKLENIVNAIQQNKYLNACKMAIIKVAYIQLAISALVFVVYQMMRFGYVSKEMHQSVVYLYQAYAALIGVLFTYLTLEDLFEDDEKHLIYSGVFVSLVVLLQFYQEGHIMEYTIFSLLFSVFIYVLFKFSERIKINFKSFPLAVNDYFNRLLPSLFVFLIVLGISYLFKANVVWIAEFIIMISKVFASLPFIILVIVLICSFWVLGIHGVGVIGTLFRPFWFYMALINTYLVLLGSSAIFLGSEVFYQWAVWIGGSGATFGLAFAARFFAKSEHLKQNGKESFHASLFNINETVIFGIPVVSNHYFNIPFFLAPIISTLISYAAIKLNLVSIPSLVSPWVMPLPIGIFISTLGDWRSIVLAFVLLLSSFLVYYPFFKKYDNKLYLEENSK